MFSFWKLSLMANYYLELFKDVDFFFFYKKTIVENGVGFSRI